MERKELKSALKEEAAAFPGKVSWLYSDLHDREEYLSFHAGRQTIAAGLIKVPVMLGILDCAMHEILSLNDRLDVPGRRISPDTEVFEYGRANVSVYELLYWMTAGNDDTAANVLLKRLRRKKLNAYFESIGLKKTQLNHKKLEYKTRKAGIENYTSLKDICHIYRGLHEGTLLNETCRSVAKLLLKECRDDSMIRRYLCDGWSCEHKSGILPGTAHDTAMFNNGRTIYFFGVSLTEFAHDKQTMREARRLIGRMSRIIAEYVSDRDVQA